MGDVFGILAVALVYIFVIASSNSRKKKKQSARQSEARQERAARFDQAFEKADARQAHARTPEPPARPQPEQVAWDLETAGEGEDPCHEGRLRPAQPGVRLKVATQAAMAHAGEGEDPCHEGRLRPAQPGVRLKAATQAAMARAGEGEDPCHDAPRREAEDTAYDSPIYAPVLDRGEFARQALSGVVMSEVLKRPCERRLERKLRRGA